ncbi:hypothetical protein NDU88_003901 [Pleurodeles waltl]|uniref:Uncharacterized protein n=1 Tax=Pleurodeles waltl TaxID=8319 RepID=A0AAV7LIC2_PLEWA|nr:hypothetical protein NDU88_003901 [Pleurodeles waltl]
MNPGDRDPAREWTRARLVRSYEARAALGRGEESRTPVSDSGAPRTSTEADPPLEGPGGLGLEDPPLRVRDRPAVALTIGGWKAVPLPATARAYPRGQAAYQRKDYSIAASEREIASALKYPKVTGRTNWARAIEGGPVCGTRMGVGRQTLPDRSGDMDDSAGVGHTEGPRTLGEASPRVEL